MNVHEYFYPILWKRSQDFQSMPNFSGSTMSWIHSHVSGVKGNTGKAWECDSFWKHYTYVGCCCRLPPILQAEAQLILTYVNLMKMVLSLECLAVFFFQKCSFVVFSLVMFLLPLYTLYPEIFASTKFGAFVCVNQILYFNFRYLRFLLFLQISSYFWKLVT